MGFVRTLTVLALVFVGCGDPVKSTKLASLTASAGVLDPAFDSDVRDYHLDLLYTEAVTSLTPTAELADQTITLDGATVASGTPSAALALTPGNRDVTIVVGGETTYTIHVHRGVDAVAALAMPGGSLTPTFAPETTDYRADFGATTSTTVTPTLWVPARAAVTVNGTEVASGTPSASIALPLASTVTVEVAPLTRPAQTYRLQISRDGAWGTATLVEMDDTWDAGYERVGIDDAGNAIAVWATDDTVWANRFVPGSGWGATPEPLEVGAGLRPDVAVAGDGSAVAVWPGGGTVSPGTRRFLPASGWEPEVPIALLSYLKVELDGVGSPMVVGTAQLNADAGTDAGASRLVPGTGWTSPDTLDNSVDEVQSSALAVSRTGRAAAIWGEFRFGTEWVVVANVYSPSTGWGTAQTVHSATNNSVYLSGVAIDDAGNAIVVGQTYETSSSTYHAWARRFDADTGWEALVPLETMSPTSSATPDVAMDADGNALVVWYQYWSTPAPRASTWARRHVPGTGWEAPVELTGSALYPKVAFDSAGNAVVVSQANNVVANRFDAFAATWRPAETIGVGPVYSLSRVQLAVSPPGYAVAIWAESDGTRTNIWANTFR